jgi:hypothetical protein
VARGELVNPLFALIVTVIAVGAIVLRPVLDGDSTADGTALIVGAPTTSSRSPPPPPSPCSNPGGPAGRTLRRYIGT